MTIECPQCRTRFRRPPASRLGSPEPLFQCSRCRHIFRAPSTQRSEEERDTEEAPGPAEPPPAQPSLPFDLDEFELRPTAEAAEFDLVTEETPVFSMRPFYVLLFLVGSFFVLSGALLARPPLALVPLLSAAGLLGPPPLARELSVEKLESSYVRLKTGETILVVRGRVRNDGVRTLREAEVEARVLDGEGRELARSSSLWGDFPSLRFLAELSPPELRNLEETPPPASFGVSPGEAAPFTVVFFAPPEKASFVTVRVTRAR